MLTHFKVSFINDFEALEECRRLNVDYFNHSLRPQICPPFLFVATCLARDEACTVMLSHIHVHFQVSAKTSLQIDSWAVAS